MYLLQANILKTTTGLGAGKTFYMITNANGNGQAINAALARAKGVASVATVSGSPRIITIPAVGNTGIQSIRSVTMPSLRAASSGSAAIVVDARKGGTPLSKAEQHQSKADRIVAEAIAKAQAEGISLDTTAGATNEMDKRRRRKKNPDAETDVELEASARRKRFTKPKTPVASKTGARSIEPLEEVILDMNAEGLAISEECEVATAKSIDNFASGYGNTKSVSKMKSKKRK
jgi:hypothetical protein